MASLISGCSSQTVDAAIFGSITNDAQQYISNKVQGLTQVAGNLAGNIKEGIQHHLNNFTNYFDNDHMVNTLRNQIANFFDPSAILYLDTQERIQGANPTMQNYIMSNPVLNEQYQDNIIHGYGVELKDEEREYYHRQYSNNIFYEQSDGRHKATSYLVNRNDCLSFHEQVNINLTIDKVLSFMDNNIDVTSLEGDNILD